MKNAGKIFKNIRISRNITLKEAAGESMSIATLSKFEKGMTSISAENLNTALSNIYLCANEFNYLLREFQDSELLKLIKNIEININNEKKMLELYHGELEKINGKSRTQFHLLNSIILKNLIEIHFGSLSVNKQEKQIVSDYLFNNEYWREYELFLFLKLKNLWSLDTYYNYCNAILSNNNKFESNHLETNLIHSMLMDGIFMSLKENDIKKAKYFLDHSKSFLEKFDYFYNAYYKIIQKIAENYFIFKSKKSLKHLNHYKQGIDILEYLDYPDKADYYRKVTAIQKTLNP